MSTINLRGKMKITFLGQAGFLIEKFGKSILIDPYLSDNVKNFEPNNYRRVEIDERFLKFKPDIIIITHNHLDHFDKETLKHYFHEESKIITLSPVSVWKDIRKSVGQNTHFLLNTGTSISFWGITFYAVKAEHSDENAIGVVIQDKKDFYFFTGDTLFSEKVFSSLPTKRYKAVFLPINGVGNNMNVADAKRFVKRLQVKNVVPCHFGMFDDMTGEELKVKQAVIPKIYKEIKLK